MTKLFKPGLWLLLLTTIGCSTFNRGWKLASKTPPPPNDIQGRWEGTWLSQTNGHHGKLRCLLNQQTESKYLARFFATYAKIFHFSYDVTLSVRHPGAEFEFEGEAELGRLAGGHYSYSGHASPTNFFATYKTKADGGIFQMSRPLH